MSNFVKISSISATPCVADLALSNRQLVEKAIVHLEAAIQPVLPGRPDLIVLPECCDRPQDLPRERQADYYRDRGDQVLRRMQELAVRHHSYIAYAAVWAMADGTFRNATRLIDRQGKVAGIYHKNHLVVEENTEGNILYGREAPIIQCDFGRVACAICFDLNFDELRLKYAAARPDLIVFCSNYHGGLMQHYWAYSCRAHFVGAIGSLKLAPASIISPLGDLLAGSSNYIHHITATVNLDCCIAHLDYNWEKLDRMKAEYGDRVRVSVPSYLGSVLISSETDKVSAREMAGQFEIELLDDYFARVRAHRREPSRMEAG